MKNDIKRRIKIAKLLGWKHIKWHTTLDGREMFGYPPISLDIIQYTQPLPLKFSMRIMDILEDLERRKAVSPSTASYVLGCDYALALKMVKDDQIGAVIGEGTVRLKRQIYTSPMYKFYLLY